MFSCWRLVLLLSLIALFISHSESTFLNDEEEQLRTFGDIQLESVPDIGTLKDEQRSLYNKRDHLKNYRETPFNSWAGKREEDVVYDSIRHKRNPLGLRELTDYRPYWFARDLRGSQEAKVYRPVRATFSAWGGK